MSAACVSPSARPLAMSGMALATPPVPVLVPTPAPVRLNHSSSVKDEARSWPTPPSVAYWALDPATQTGGVAVGRSHP